MEGGIKGMAAHSKHTQESEATAFTLNLYFTSSETPLDSLLVSCPDLVSQESVAVRV